MQHNLNNFLSYGFQYTLDTMTMPTTNSAVSDIILRVISNDRCLHEIWLDGTWAAHNLIYAMKLLQRPENSHLSVCVHADSIIEAHGVPMIQKIDDFATYARRKHNLEVDWLLNDIDTLLTIAKASNFQSWRNFAAIVFLRNDNELMPLTLWPHMLSKLTSLGWIDTVFQLLQCRNDVVTHPALLEDPDEEIFEGMETFSQFHR
jgi:hypothetical protein